MVLDYFWRRRHSVLVAIFDLSIFATDAEVHAYRKLSVIALDVHYTNGSSTYYL